MRTLEKHKLNELDEKYLGDEEITFTTNFLERCIRDPHTVALNFGMDKREARLIAGLAGQCLRLESALAACRGSLAERYGA